MSNTRRLETFLTLSETDLQKFDEVAEFLTGDKKENKATLHHTIVPRMREYKAVKIHDSRLTMTADEMLEDRVSYLSNNILNEPFNTDGFSEDSEVHQISEIGKVLSNPMRLETLLYMEDNQKQVYTLEEIAEASGPKYYWPKNQLHHIHIPKLEENNFIERNIERNNQEIHERFSDSLHNILQYEIDHYGINSSIS